VNRRDLPKSVYIARGLVSGLIKIGVTWHIPERLKLLANATEPVELIASLRGSWNVEQSLHQRFAALLARGREWYRDDGSIMALVEALPASQRGSVVFPKNGRRGGRRSEPKYPRVNRLLFPVQNGARGVT